MGCITTNEVDEVGEGGCLSLTSISKIRFYRLEIHVILLVKLYRKWLRPIKSLLCSVDVINSAVSNLFIMNWLMVNRYDYFLLRLGLFNFGVYLTYNQIGHWERENVLTDSLSILYWLDFKWRRGKKVEGWETDTETTRPFASFPSVDLLWVSFISLGCLTSYTGTYLLSTNLCVTEG